MQILSLEKPRRQAKPFAGLKKLTCDRNECRAIFRENRVDDIAQSEWQQVREVFEDVLLQPPEERRIYTQRLCGSHESLWNEVKSLLDWHESSESFLETPAVVHVIENNQLHNQLVAGQRLLHYEIRYLIGAGGMGEVYLAHDTSIDRNVALKLLRRDLLPHTGTSERLRSEARAAAQLDHPNICKIYDISEAHGFSFIVMQYIVGTTLDDILHHGELSVAAALNIGAQVAEGLAEAHYKRIIHRDVKPANIIVSKKGHATMLDFGLAKFVDAQTGAGRSSRLESTGGLMGTVPYMSPEQLRGEPVDARTDVFSLGAMLFEMLSGVHPFRGESNADTISTILINEPDWSLIPLVVRPMLHSCLAKDVADRYESAGKLAHAIREVRTHVPTAGAMFSYSPGTNRIDSAILSNGETTRHLYVRQRGVHKRLQLSDGTVAKRSSRESDPEWFDFLELPWVVPLVMAGAYLIPLFIGMVNKAWQLYSAWQEYSVLYRGR
jgi:serine/threonine protein kinase